MKKHKLKKSEIDTSISQFVGPQFSTLEDKKAGIIRQCDVCGKEDATWLHQVKKGGFALICFTCGNH